jgi:hypothetical protein
MRITIEDCSNGFIVDVDGLRSIHSFENITDWVAAIMTPMNKVIVDKEKRGPSGRPPPLRSYGTRKP